MSDRGTAVVVVTRNTREQLRVLLDGIADAGDLVREIVVVDNDSSDGTDALVAEHPTHPKRIFNSPGRGFAAGINQGVRASTAPDIVVATASSRLTTNALDAMQRELHSADDIAAVAPLIRSLDGTVQRHGLFAPTPLTAVVVLFRLERFAMFRGEAERYYGPHRPGPAIDVDNISGACFLVRREAWNAVGEFDERFFLYAEDVDWSLRARKAGWRLRFAPNVEVRREKSVTARTDSVGSIRLYYRSLRVFYRKHHSASPLPVRALWLAGAYAREGIELLANRLRRQKGLRY
jgi:GT2 family glycosyltransferase